MEHRHRNNHQGISPLPGQVITQERYLQLPFPIQLQPESAFSRSRQGKDHAVTLAFPGERAFRRQWRGSLRGPDSDAAPGAVLPGLIRSRCRVAVPLSSPLRALTAIRVVCSTTCQLSICGSRGDIGGVAAAPRCIQRVTTCQDHKPCCAQGAPYDRVAQCSPRSKSQPSRPASVKAVSATPRNHTSMLSTALR